MKSVLDNYAVLQQLWDDCLEEHLQSDIKARIIGIQAQMKKFEFFFGLQLNYLILRHSDNLSRTLQSKTTSAAIGQSTASMSIKTLESLRPEDKFELFWSMVCVSAANFEIGDPSLPRKRKRPVRFEEGQCSSHYPDTPKYYFKLIYFEAVDLIVNCIKQRFDQPGYNVYKNMEQLLLNTITDQEYSAEFTAVVEKYGSDFDAAQLGTQLETLHSNFKGNANTRLKDIVDYFKSLPVESRGLYNQILTLLTLILVMPATNAISERSFSQLRRIKTYLRSTMSQERLNHCMILNAYQEIDQLNLTEIANEFVCTEHRLSIFGRFT